MRLVQQVKIQQIQRKRSKCTKPERNLQLLWQPKSLDVQLCQVVKWDQEMCNRAWSWQHAHQKDAINMLENESDDEVDNFQDCFDLVGRITILSLILLSKAKENGTLIVVLPSTSIAILMQLLNSRKKMALPCVVKNNIITKKKKTKEYILKFMHYNHIM